MNYPGIKGERCGCDESLELRERIAELEANQKTEAERILCNWAKCGVRCTEQDGPYLQLVGYANAVWDEAHSPKPRTLDDVVKDLRERTGWDGCGESYSELLDELQALLDGDRAVLDALSGMREGIVHHWAAHCDGEPHWIALGEAELARRAAKGQE